MDRVGEATTTFVNPMEQMLGFQLRRASVAVMSVLADELAVLGLNSSLASLVVLIGANAGCTQSEISRVLRAKPANLVPLINQLVALGALQRNPGRGRAIALSLSEKGEDLLVSVRAALARNDVLSARNMSKDDQASAIAMLQLICDNACSALDKDYMG